MKRKKIFGLLIIFLSTIIVLVIIRNSSQTESLSELPRHSSLEDITFVDDIINIYYFWGDGCTHCADQFEFLTEINEEIGEKFTLYSFEVWFDEENVELAHEIAEMLDTTFQGVPFTVIGNQAISGFSPNEILDAINSPNEFDIMRIIIEEG